MLYQVILLRTYPTIERPFHENAQMYLGIKVLNLYHVLLYIYGHRKTRKQRV